MSPEDPRRRRGARKAIAALAVFAVFGAAPVTAMAAVGAPQAVVVPAAVPVPGPDETVIVVQVGGDSDLGTDETLPLEGVELSLYDSENAGPAVPETWATCTSDEDGDCVFTVPETGAGMANEGRQFWVKWESAPSGWFGVDSLRTGTATSIDTTPYQFQTPAMAGGSTFTSGTDFMNDIGDLVDTSSSGFWQQSRVNPDVADKCGLAIALLLDLSYSINDEELALLKEAGVGFVDALEGTPSTVAVYTFATTAPARGAANGTLPLTSVATEEGADEVRSKINGLNGQAGYTNWDGALLQIAQANESYDAVVLVTDGNPTTYNPGSESVRPATTRFYEVERGVSSANAVKDEGTKIFAVGILNGSPVTDPDISLNLEAVSGRTLDEDYFLVEDFDALGSNLEALALRACESSISVVKRVIPAGGTIDDAVPAAGWEFSAQSIAAVTPTSAITPASGAVSFTVDLQLAATAPVTITETQQDGFSLVQQGGFNAVCTRLVDNVPVAVTNDGATGFIVDADRDTGITCDVVNQAAAAPGTPGISLVKDADVAMVDSVGDVITYTFTSTNTGDQTLTDVIITDPLPGLSDLSCEPEAPATLAPGESMVCEATYTVTQADLDAGVINNVATTTGTPPRGRDVTDTDDHTVPATTSSGINIVKTPSSTQVAPGTDVTFSYAVTNTGNAALSDVVVTDDKCSPVTYVSGDADRDQRLDVDETWMFTCTANITQTTTNVGTSTGKTPGGDTVTSSDDATVTVVSQGQAPPPSSGEIPQTGGPAWTQAFTLIGFALLAFGAALYFLRRRGLGVSGR